MDRTTINDQEILDYITQLVHEEHQLREGIAGGQLGDEVKAQLRALEIRLDQYWDLLRQRQGRRDAGLDPDEATLRPAEIVEKYEQ
jgi:hypothetical protein